MDEVQLEEIELRALAATREPWRLDPGAGNLPHRVTTGLGDPVATTYHGGRWPTRDAVFIAAARTDVPALVAEVRRLQRTGARAGRAPIGPLRWAAVLTCTLAYVAAACLSLVGGLWQLVGGLLALVGAFVLGWLTRDAGHGGPP